MDETVIQHHGILGQKWGVRRFQNKDGTLTAEGKRRARSGKTEDQKASETEKRHDSKNRGTLTNAQLKEKIERLKLERELRDLTDDEINRGRKFVRDIMTDVGKKTLTTALTGAALYGTKAAVSKEFNRKELGEAIFNGGPKKK